MEYNTVTCRSTKKNCVYYKGRIYDDINTGLDS